MTELQKKKLREQRRIRQALALLCATRYVFCQSQKDNFGNKQQMSPDLKDKQGFAFNQKQGENTRKRGSSATQVKEQKRRIQTGRIRVRRTDRYL